MLASFKKGLITWVGVVPYFTEFRIFQKYFRIFEKSHTKISILLKESPNFNKNNKNIGFKASANADSSA